MALYSSFREYSFNIGNNKWLKRLIALVTVKYGKITIPVQVSISQIASIVPHVIVKAKCNIIIHILSNINAAVWILLKLLRFPLCNFCNSFYSQPTDRTNLEWNQSDKELHTPGIKY